MKSKNTDKQNRQMIQSETGTNLPKSESGSIASHNSKRRLLKSIVTTAPAVLAVSSKPALANFCTVSGMMSGNLSNPGGQTGCGGISPGGYKENPNRSARTESFQSIFGVLWHGKNNSSEGWDSNTTFNDVLNFRGNQDTYEFGAHVVAAYINAVEIPGYGQTPADVKEIVRQIVDNSFYRDPTTGITLDAQAYVDFIQQTFY